MRWGLCFTNPVRARNSPGSAAEIIRQLPPFIVKVGVFVNAEVDFVTSAVRECGLNLLQFHGDEPPEYCLQFGVMSMKAFRVRDAESLKLCLATKPTRGCWTYASRTVWRQRRNLQLGPGD